MEMKGSEPMGIRWQCFNYNSWEITMIIMASRAGVERRFDLQRVVEMISKTWHSQGQNKGAAGKDLKSKNG